MNRHVPTRSSEASDRAGRLAVLMAPDYRRDNPYQTLLGQALEDRGATVWFPRGYRRVLPLRRMLGQEGRRPDVLHLHWIAPYLKGAAAGAKALYAARLVLDAALVRRAGVRFVWTVHNLIEHEEAHEAVELWCRRRLARLADALIVHSPEARDLVAARYRITADKIAVIPHGDLGAHYGPPIAKARARQQLGLPQEGRIFLFFGMVRPYKGVLKLLAAWESSPELHARHTLLIAGDAPDPEHGDAVRAAAERTRNVRLRLERVPDAQVPLYFSAADAVVLPFERSLTSGSLVLAQSYARPVVTTLSACGTYEPGSGSEARVDAIAELARALRDDPAGEARPARADWRLVAAEHARLIALAQPGALS